MAWCVYVIHTMGLRLFLGSNKFARHNRIGVTKMCVRRRKYLPAIRLSDGEGVKGCRRREGVREHSRRAAGITRTWGYVQYVLMS